MNLKYIQNLWFHKKISDLLRHVFQSSSELFGNNHRNALKAVYQLPHLMLIQH